MKKVLSPSDVCHAWANQLQDEARNSGDSLYFRKETIYSYGHHFPIAKHVVNERGERAVLFTERTYSNTTAKHIAWVRQAANHLNRIYCYNPESTHEQNFSSWVTEAKHIAANLLKAKKPEKYLNELSRVSLYAEKYATFFNIAIPHDLQDVLQIKNKDQFTEFAAKEAEYKAEQEKQREAELKAKHKKELAKWLKGETHRLYTHNGFDYLRLNDERIETTQAVQIPMAIGKAIWQKVKTDTLTVGDKIMNFEVNEVGKVVKIGCHTFKADYLLKFGEKIFS